MAREHQVAQHIEVVEGNLSQAFLEVLEMVFHSGAELQAQRECSGCCPPCELFSKLTRYFEERRSE